MNLSRISSLKGRTGSVEMGFSFCSRVNVSLEQNALLLQTQTYRKLQHLPRNLDLLNSNASPLEDVTVQVERSPFLGHCVRPSFNLHRHLQHG
jgi:hypothetical protein